MITKISVKNGELLSEVCRKLRAQAPAEAVFNEIRLGSRPGDSVDYLMAVYHAADAWRRRLPGS